MHECPMCHANWQFPPLVITEHEPSGLQHAPVAGQGSGLHARFGCHLEGAAHPASVVCAHMPALLQHAPIGGHGAVAQVWAPNQWQLTTSDDVPVMMIPWHCDCGAMKHAVFGQQHAPTMFGHGLFGVHDWPGKKDDAAGHCVLGTTTHPLAAVTMQHAPVRMQFACEHGVLANHLPPCCRHSHALAMWHVPSGRQQAPLGHGALAHDPLAIHGPMVDGQFAAADV